MNQNLIHKVFRNTALGICFKILTLVVSLASRSVFVLFLSDEHLGVNGLYGNILSLLSMADFGISAVMIHILYEPLACQDTERLVALVKLFKRLYRIIALVILGLGLSMIPVLPCLVTNHTLTDIELVKYYLIFLVNTAASYMGTYKATLLIADQKGYCVNAVYFLSNVLRIIAQIAVLFVTHNFTAYLLTALLGTAANNIALMMIANHHYPAVRNAQSSVDVSAEKMLIVQKTKSVFLYRCGGVLIDSTDNVLISVLVGTAVVGYYSNYSIITTNVFALLGVLSQACMTGIGNCSVNADKSDRKKAYFDMVVLYFIIATLILCGMLSVFNDFIYLWLGQDRFVLSQGFVAVLATRLFIDIILSPNWVFRESQGMFDEARSIRLWGAGINLILSVIMGKLWGLSGIIGATTVAKMLTTLWFEPKIICNRLFKESVCGYWKQWLHLMLLALCAVTVSLLLSMAVDQIIRRSAIGLLIKGFACVFTVICVFGAWAVSQKAYRVLLQEIVKKIKKIFRKNR